MAEQWLLVMCKVRVTGLVWEALGCTLHYRGENAPTLELHRRKRMVDMLNMRSPSPVVPGHNRRKDLDIMTCRGILVTELPCHGILEDYQGYPRGREKKTSASDHSHFSQIL